MCCCEGTRFIRVYRMLLVSIMCVFLACLVSTRIINANEEEFFVILLISRVSQLMTEETEEQVDGASKESEQRQPKHAPHYRCKVSIRSILCTKKKKKRKRANRRCVVNIIS